MIDVKIKQLLDIRDRLRDQLYHIEKTIDSMQSECSHTFEVTGTTSHEDVCCCRKCGFIKFE